jgi:hypothetical protein
MSNPEKSEMEFSRRRLLMNTLFGAGLLGLRSLATGIPMAILANPRRALATGGTAGSPSNTAVQYLVFASSGSGDPINANAPGMYLNSAIGHPADPTMAPTSLTLAGKAFTAAQPWSTLPQPLLDRMCFFNHGTYTVVHPDEVKVLSLEGDTQNDEMFMSLLASQLAPALGTVQVEPIVLGPRNTSEDISYQGRPQPILSPASLASLLAPPTGPLGQLVSLRDNDLNRLNAYVKSQGNKAQAAFIDQYVISQTQARALSESLLTVLAGIQDNSPASQVTAAVTLIRMNAAPVISINIPFGGDNHTDMGLANETAQTITGVATIGQLWSQLVAAGIQDRVSFLSLNVFGRTLDASTSANGRGHNGNHHLAVMFGKPFSGSVIGGVEPVMGDFGAMSINSANGAGVPNGGGNVPFAQTLQSMALTFGTGVGMTPTFLSQNIKGGTVIPAALAAA